MVAYTKPQHRKKKIVIMILIINKFVYRNNLSACQACKSKELQS